MDEIGLFEAIYSQRQRLCQMLCMPRLGSVLFNSNPLLELCPRDDCRHLLRTL